MNESEFIEQVDCRFPYGRPLDWRRLSAQAARVSPNAAFMVLHEICRVPRSVVVSPALASAMVRHWRRRFRHPLCRVLAPVVQAYVGGVALRPAQAARLMRKVAAYPDQYNALALCYFSAEDRAGALDRLFETVTSTWDAARQE